VKYVESEADPKVPKGTDIVAYAHNGDSAETVAANYGKYPAPTREQYDALPVMDYGAAMKYRDDRMRRKTKDAKDRANAATQKLEWFFYAQKGEARDEMPIVYYGDTISPNMTRTPEGYLICRNVPIGRIGEMEYLGSELDPRADPGALLTVSRDEADLFAPAALASFEGKPVTNGHPPRDVEAGNWPAYARGHVQNVRRGEGGNAGKMVADLFITDPMLIAEIEAGKREVSSGYSCVYAINQDGTISQRRIRGNHVAVVGEGRAGSSVSIKDSAPYTKAHERRKRAMSKKLNSGSQFSGFLNLFARSARDAKTVDEVEDIVTDAAEVLESISAEGEAAPPDETGKTPAETVKGAAGDDGNAALIAAIRELAAKLDGFLKGYSGSPAADTAKAEPEPGGAGKKDRIQELLDELGAETKGTGARDTDAAEQEEALLVPPETVDVDEVKKADTEASLRDAAIRILSAARPAIAALKDPGERGRMTDALVESVKGRAGGAYAAVLDNAVRLAVKNARDAKEPEYFDSAARQAAYDKRNPHLKRGE
jgi:hypothetical protein